MKNDSMMMMTSGRVFCFFLLVALTRHPDPLPLGSAEGTSHTLLGVALNADGSNACGGADSGADGADNHLCI